MRRGGDELPENDTTDTVPYTVLSRRAITSWAVAVVVAGVGMAVWLLLAYGGDDATTQLDAIRTAGTIVVGTGGAAALLLAARRQRATEIALKHTEAALRQKDRDQEHQQRATEATEADAEARRITELYTTAAGQLGSDKAPVRLAGLYALERLAQNNPGQRQTIVNVLCAYLRMPFTAPGEPPRSGAETRFVADHTERTQELEVRLTAQRVLRDHLHPGAPDATPPATFWPEIDLDLTRATLVDFTLGNCRVRTAAFQEARFTGITSFRGTRFTGAVSFRDTRFDDHATFQDARFDDHTSFVGVQFADDTTFSGTRFATDVPDDVVPFLPTDEHDGADQDVSSAGAVTPATLTERERELLVLLHSGSTDHDAAESLGVSVRTVRRLIARLMDRLGARSRFAAGARAAELGWLVPPRPADD